jgi:hypothetical protein
MRSEQTDMRMVAEAWESERLIVEFGRDVANSLPKSAGAINDLNGINVS